MRRRFLLIAPWMGLTASLTGCHHPSMSAVSLAPRVCDDTCGFPWGIFHHEEELEGIPFYLPKPLLVVAKNFRNIEEAKVGLTDPAPIPGYFDDQAKYADLNARTNFQIPANAGGVKQGDPSQPLPANQFPKNSLTNPVTNRIFSTANGGGAPLVPGSVPPADRLAPETFFTYQIVFVPDLTQKYGLVVKGGAGEIRAAMNLVNGWMFTGLGPYYMKDSSTTQNVLAGGITANLAASGVANVISSIAGLGRNAVPASGPAAQNAPSTVTPTAVTETFSHIRDMAGDPHPIVLPKYAQISIYEAYLTPEGTMEWKPIVERTYDRAVIGAILQGGVAMAKAPGSKRAGQLVARKANEGKTSARGGAAATLPGLPAPDLQGGAFVRNPSLNPGAEARNPSALSSPSAASGSTQPPAPREGRSGELVSPKPISGRGRVQRAGSSTIGDTTALPRSRESAEGPTSLRGLPDRLHQSARVEPPALVDSPPATSAPPPLRAPDASLMPPDVRGPNASQSPSTTLSPN